MYNNIIFFLQKHTTYRHAKEQYPCHIEDCSQAHLKSK